MDPFVRLWLVTISAVGFVVNVGCTAASSPAPTSETSDVIGSATPPSAIVIGQIPISVSRTPKVSFVGGKNADQSSALAEARVEVVSTGAAVSSWSAISTGIVSGLALTPGVAYRIALRSRDNQGTVSIPVYSDAWIAQIGSGNWSATTLSNAPAGRTYYSMIWTGDKMIVWGGGVPGVGFADTGGIYDPVSNTWSATSMVNVPAARMSHSAVWTGSDMIIWGGTLLATGAKYRPNTDTWTSITNVGAPSGRSLQTAVWTGSKMIVWGGSAGGSSYLNTGGSYNPIADSWSSTATIGAPIARQSHTAIWTGSKMIIWGGTKNVSGTGVDLNDGGMYDPNTDTWTATSTIGSPTARSLHLAFWTGSKMIVWGGRDSTGGMFDPATNSWESLPTIGMPAGESDPTVWMGSGFSWPLGVWTGSKLIVWSGYTGYGTTTTGAVYDPVTNAWTATSTSSAAAGRYVSSAIWTGSQMVVWGGYNSTPSAINSGGLYTP